jgi:hypothetical protein
MDSFAPRAALNRDQSKVIMMQGAWRAEFSTAELPRWIKMYRGLRDRKEGRYARLYAPSVAALERVASKLQVAGR